MISFDELQAVWKQIRIPVVGEQVEARELTVIKLIYGSPLLTIDSKKQRHLLIPVPDDQQTYEDTNSSGIHITTQRWGMMNHIGRYIDIACLKPHLNDLFDLIVLDIFDELLGDAAQPDLSAHAVLERWRDLLQSSGPKLPSKRKVIGLFGELWFLREMTKLVTTAVDAWQGPHNGRYDFYTGQSAIEVKTSRETVRKSAVIHGHMQLEPPPNGLLYFLRVQVETGIAAQETLEALVKDIITLGCDQRKLYAALLRVGFTIDIIERTRDIRINVLGVEAFQVDDQFPKITRSSFIGGELPPGVSDIQYRVDLSGIRPAGPDEYNRFIKQVVEEISNAALS
ncbi:MAG: hypothetical protein OHK0046_36860 [Anaerolineae bacterium]